MHAYQIGLTGIAAEKQVRKYKGHRKVSKEALLSVDNPLDE
jgi:hypothetical protein